MPIGAVMAVVRVTRRFAGLLGVIALVGIILLVGPPETPSSSGSTFTDVDFAPALPSDALAPDPTLPAALGLHRIGVGSWASGTSSRDLPSLMVQEQDASSGVRDRDVLAAAVGERARDLREDGVRVASTSRMVFGGLPGTEQRATRGDLDQTTWLAVSDHVLYTATVLHAPEDARVAETLLETFAFTER